MASRVMAAGDSPSTAARAGRGPIEAAWPAKARGPKRRARPAAATPVMKSRLFMRPILYRESEYTP